jgi:uncharacterized protein YndB with AHSA1/START domain
MTRQIEVAVEINAPAAGVFAWLQPERLSSWWNPAAGLTVIPIAKSPLQLGSRLRLNADGVDVEVEVTEFSPPALLSWRAANGDGVTFLVFPVDFTSGVQVIEHYTPRGLGGALRERLGGKAQQRARLAAALERLRTLAEEEARSIEREQLAKYEARRAAKGVTRSPVQLVPPPNEVQPPPGP